MNVAATDHNNNNSHSTTEYGNASSFSSLLLNSPPTRTRDLLLLSMTEQPERKPQPNMKQRSSSKGTTTTTTGSSTKTVVDSMATGSNKLQQLKASLREQRRRHATILCGGTNKNSNNNNNNSTTRTSSCDDPIKCHPLPRGSSSAISVDGTTNSNSSSSKNSYGDTTTVTTAQSTMMDSLASTKSRNSSTGSEQRQQHSSTYSNRIIQQLNTGISPLSCNTGMVRTPTYNPNPVTVRPQSYLHLHKSIHVPALNVPSLSGTSDYANASPANSSFDDDDESTASFLKPPTLEEIYAAMGETLDSPTSPIRPIPLNQIKDPGSPRGTSNVSVPTAPQLPSDDSHQSPTIPSSTMKILPSTPPPSQRQLGFNTSTDNGVKAKRSSFISKLYDSPIQTPPPGSRRPTTGLRRFEQQASPKENDIVDSITISATKVPVANNDRPNTVLAYLDETSLSDDVLDALSSTPNAVLSVQTTSSATLSLSESILDSDTDDDDDDNACDYTTNSDTSGWASMGDSTAGPLGCSDSITTDHNSLGSSPLTCLRIASPAMKGVMQPSDDLTFASTPSVSNPPVLPKRKNNQEKKKNTVTFQIESIEVNIAKNQAPQKQDKPTQAAITLQLLKASTNAVNKPLFVSARRADELCMTYGGHFSIAIRCGMKLIQPASEERIKLLPLQIKTTSPSLNVRLSTDFRCGTYGSLYDIAMRSGSKDAIIVKDWREVHNPTAVDQSKAKKVERKSRTRVIRTTTTTTRNTQQHPVRPQISSSDRIPAAKKTNRTTEPNGAGKSTTKQPAPYVPVRGGIYDTALQSGLTKDSIRARTAYSITLKQPSESRRQRNHKVELVPERISDQQCGVRSLVPVSSMNTGQ